MAHRTMKHVWMSDRFVVEQFCKSLVILMMTYTLINESMNFMLRRHRIDATKRMPLSY